MSNEQDAATQVMTGAAQELVKSSYNDLVHPTVKAVGEIVALPFQAVSAALTPLKVWIAHKNHSYQEVVSLLAKKLENIPPENIVPPEPYIGVPALQQISYCMDNEELRNMYANLLARAMNKDTKNDVHPSFVEIIKNLSPDEAVLLKYICTYFTDLKFANIPTISLHKMNNPMEYEVIISRFSNFPEKAGCQQQPYVKKYFDNLERLKIIDFNVNELVNDVFYKDLIENDFIKESRYKIHKKFDGKFNCDYAKNHYALTDFGISFCKICILD